MEPFFEDYLRVLEPIVEGFCEAVNDLPQAGLDWSPGPEMNSIAVLVAHTAGSLRYWIGDVAAGDPSGRDREAEFKTHGISTGELINRLEASSDYARRALGKLPQSDLAAQRVAPLDGRQVTCSWALLHALEHAAQHVAHTQLTRQLWDIKVKGA